MIKDGKGDFYRRLRISKELRELITFFRKIKRKMINEGDKKRK